MSVDLFNSLKAGISSFVGATGYVIFSKEIIEAVIASAFIAQGLDPTDAPYNYMIAAISGGVYGASHQAVARFTTGMMNSLLAINRYAPQVGDEGEKQLRELLSVTLPAVLMYTICQAVRGSLTEEISNPWTVGLSKFAASSIAGGLTGIVTDIIGQLYSDKFSVTKPASSMVENIKKEMNTLGTRMTGRRIGREFVGKFLGGVMARCIAVPIAPLDLPGASSPVGWGATQGALGKFIFQAGFYSGLHGGAAVGNLVDRALRPTPDQKPSVATDAIFVTQLPQEATQASHSSSGSNKSASEEAGGGENCSNLGPPSEREEITID